MDDWKWQSVWVVEGYASFYTSGVRDGFSTNFGKKVGEGLEVISGKERRWNLETSRETPLGRSCS